MRIGMIGLGRMCAKNPKFPDTYYVDALVGPDTVDTMPPATIAAYRERGNPEIRIDRDVDAAYRTIAAIRSAGVDLDAVLARLEADGVASFAKSYETLLAVVERRALATVKR